MNEANVERMARVLRALRYRPAPFAPLAALRVEDPGRHLANFTFFMVAIDHDTQRNAVVYEAVVDGKLLHGSDLLYALAVRAKLADQNSFLARSFATIDERRVARMFITDAGACPHDVEGRARIFRECAAHLIAHHGGDVVNLLAAAGDRAGALFERLRPMPAFADPAGKKANLLRKLLKRAGLFRPVDVDAWDVASDHVVMTMALRSGLVEVRDDGVAAALRAGREQPRDVIVRLRDVAKRAAKRVSEASGVDVDDVDDLFWAFGRKSLRRDTPLDDAGAFECDLDAAVDPAARATFVKQLNGLDETADPSTRHFRTVRGPFTRDY